MNKELTLNQVRFVSKVDYDVVYSIYTSKILNLRVYGAG